MHRFYLANASFSKSSISITDADERHHMRQVLRLKKGDSVLLFNGKGEEARGLIDKISEHHIQVAIQSVTNKRSQKSVSVILACAIPKKAKFESIIEKCTELDVDEIIPLITKRTEVIYKREKARQKNLRYQTVAINAAKQSGRVVLPVIHPITDFSQALKKITPETTALIPCLTQNCSHVTEVLQKATSPKTLFFFIGPEGDFTHEEVSAAIEAGCQPVSLGHNVLKVDTAAITVTALAHVLNPH